MWVPTYFQSRQHDTRPSRPRRLAVATGATALALWVAWVLTGFTRGHGAEVHTAFYLGAIAFVAWISGSGAGLVATAAGALLLAQAHVQTVGWITTTSFVLMGGMIAGVTGALRRSRNEAERHARALVVARQDAERARRRAESAAQAKNRFLATMSHELRTPLNALSAYTELLETGVLGPVNDRQRDALQRMLGAGHHLTTLVTDVLDTARLEAGRLPVRREAFAPAAAIADAVSFIEPRATRKGVRLIVRPGGDAIEAVGDGDRFRQVVTNLLSNAVKFTPAGGRVYVGCVAPSRHRVQVCVRDTGVGIAPEHQQRIFAAFEQVSEGLTRASEGAGLGLAISQRLVLAMGGELRVASSPGKGAEFTVILERAASALASAS